MRGGPAARVLFLNEGQHGADVMGHAAVERTLASRLAANDRIEARFVRLPPLDGFALLATRSVPLLKTVDLDLQVARWHMVQSLRVRRLVRREMRAFRPDALHVDSHAVSFALGAEMRRRPTFLSVDVTVSDWRRMGIWRPVRPHSGAALALSRALERRALAAASLVLAWTAWARRAVERDVPEATVEEHHPGVDLEVFRPPEARAGKPVRILFVGGRFAKKGGYDLLAALEGLRGEAAELDLVTPEPLPPRAGVRLHSLSVGDPRLVALYRQADVFCLPSYGDASPLALVEAMACGSAVVSTDVGAIPELLDHGTAGVVLPAGDLPRLARALAELVRDPDRRARLGRAARARCEERYDAARQASRLVELLEARIPSGAS